MNAYNAHSVFADYLLTIFKQISFLTFYELQREIRSVHDFIRSRLRRPSEKADKGPSFAKLVHTFPGYVSVRLVDCDTCYVMFLIRATLDVPRKVVSYIKTTSNMSHIFAQLFSLAILRCRLCLFLELITSARKIFHFS